MTIKRIPTYVEVAIKKRRGRSMTVEVLGPDGDKKGQIEVFSNNQAETTLKLTHSSNAGTAYAILDTEAAQALTMELVERLGPFPALVERLGFPF